MMLKKKIVLLVAKYLLRTKKRIKHLLRVPFRLHRCLWMLVLHYRSWFEPQGSVLYNTLISVLRKS